MTSNGGDLHNEFGTISIEDGSAGVVEDAGHTGVKPMRNTYDGFFSTAEHDAFDALVLHDFAY